MVAARMYKKLDTEEQKALLRWYWYTGKDQAKPLNASQKSRNCHVKLAIFDEQVSLLWCVNAKFLALTSGFVRLGCRATAIKTCKVGITRRRST